MKETHKWWLGCLAAGLLGGALVSHAVNLDAVVQADEDRPAMIVKRGSLIFQNGVSKHRPGKPWKNKMNNNRPTAEWQMDHARGKPVRELFVMIPGGGNCGPAFVDALNLKYTLANGSTTTFQIALHDEIGGTNRKVPAVIGYNLTADNSSVTPTLTFPTRGTLTEVTSAGTAGQALKCTPQGDFHVDLK